MNTSRISLLLLPVLAVAALAQPAAKNNDSKVTLRAVISAYDEVEIPAQEAGVIAGFEQYSLEGTEVEAEALLGKLDDKDLQAKKKSAEFEIKVAVAQAESDAELMAAVKTKEVAEQEVKSAEDANRKSPGSVPSNEFRRLRLTVERAGYEIELRKVERANAALTAEIKRAQLEAVEVEISRRQIVSPLDGVIIQRLKHKGEWVQPGETIFKVVRLDRLRVEGLIDSKKHSPRELAGAKVTISMEVPSGKRDEKTRFETAEGVIAFVNPVVELSGGYRVWAEIKNRKETDAEGNEHWVFRPGADAQMEIKLGSGVAARPIAKPKFSAFKKEE